MQNSLLFLTFARKNNQDMKKILCAAMVSLLTIGASAKFRINGGEESPYNKEDIKRMSAAKADEWLKAHQ